MNKALNAGGPPSSEWTELFLDDPFCCMIGPVYGTKCANPGEPVKLGLWIERRHCSKLGICHGGVLLAFLDHSLGYVGSELLGLERGGPTISISASFLEPAHEGDWLESSVQVEKSTRRMQFIRGSAMVGDRPVAQASAVYVRPQLREAP
ncbi:thioesterase superfamily protein [Sphingobium chlorophenolicum L-1]|uniref:Thioesterase superfamily protein n=1 Tax=Sphingobium chlorophenolicum L-1 TaxID=690566 RepID=F6EUI1_SPHCR|nr:PaaI family thioesterase [Sphingobium chlorophenolicum]AEG47875.1 thioesterase superfamily protein [Sphingobium chlorophenolicum L-1]